MFSGNPMPTPSSLGVWPKSVDLSDEDRHIRKCIPVKLFEGEPSCCPDCYAQDEWLEGPSGGFSVNIICGYCGSSFNYMFPFGVKRIGDINPNSVAPLIKPKFLSKKASVVRYIKHKFMTLAYLIKYNKRKIFMILAMIVVFYIGWNIPQ